MHSAPMIPWVMTVAWHSILERADYSRASAKVIAIEATTHCDNSLLAICHISIILDYQ
jgi:hypothetical protein